MSKKQKVENKELNNNIDNKETEINNDPKVEETSKEEIKQENAPKEEVKKEEEKIDYISNLRKDVKDNYNISLHEYFTKGKLYYRPGNSKAEVIEKRKRNLIIHSIFLGIFAALFCIYAAVTHLILKMELGPGCMGTSIFLMIMEAITIASTALSKEKMRTRNFFVPFSFKIKKLDNDNIKIVKHNNWGLFTVKVFTLAALIAFVIATLFLGQEVEPIYFSLIFVVFGIGEISRVGVDLITNNDRPYMLLYFKNDSVIEIRKLDEPVFFKLDNKDEAPLKEDKVEEENIEETSVDEVKEDAE